jgi:hypothetical protein
MIVVIQSIYKNKKAATYTTFLFVFFLIYFIHLLHLSLYRAFPLLYALFTLYHLQSLKYYNTYIYISLLSSMFPVHRGLYAPRSTMHQFAKPGYMTFNPFPENNIDPNQSFHSHKSPEGVQSSMPSSDFFGIDISTPKESNLGQTTPYSKK